MRGFSSLFCDNGPEKPCSETATRIHACAKLVGHTPALVRMPASLWFRPESNDIVILGKASTLVLAYAGWKRSSGFCT